MEGRMTVVRRSITNEIFNIVCRVSSLWIRSSVFWLRWTLKLIKEEYDFRFECNEVDGMAMNLLGVSKITEKGAIVHLQKDNSYILTPKGRNGRRRKIPLEEIVPSEDDNYFRYSKLKGFVHDMGAAMQGGVGGHAGLFSNAIGVGKIMQLYLNKGFIDGKKYFTANSFDQFN